MSFVLKPWHLQILSFNSKPLWLSKGQYRHFRKANMIFLPVAMEICCLKMRHARVSHLEVSSRWGGTLNLGLTASMEMLNMLFHLKVVSTETYVRSLVADTWISHWKSMLDVLIEVKGPTTFAAMFLLQLTTGLGDKVVQRSALVR